MMKKVVVLVLVTMSFVAGQVQAQDTTCTGTVFNDVNSTTQPSFCGWIEWFSDLGITAGCSSNPPLFCPNSFVTRAQMAVFMSKAMRGGDNNSVTFPNDTVGGGDRNTASGRYSTVAGGSQNIASGQYSTAAGGVVNAASGHLSTVGGGSTNIASGQHSVVAGGVLNTASGLTSTIGGGQSNTASGQYSAVAGGTLNTASGNNSFAVGRRARAIFDGCFVWSDSIDQETTCGGTNRFVARASGGVFFITNGLMTSGVRVLPGSSTWQTLSDRATKENFAEVDGKEILGRLSQIPIRTWNWKTQEPSIRHMGPVSQDFYAAFKVGEDDKHISTVDADGVALAAIQGLYQVVKEQEARIKEKDDNIERQDTRIRQLEAVLAEVMKRVSALEAPTDSIAQK